MHRLVASLVLVTFLFASCTKMVVVPFDEGQFPDRGRHRITLKDERVFETKDLSRQLNDTITFTSLNKSYRFPLEDVATIERIEVDTGRTVAAVAVLAVVLGTAFYFIVGSFVSSLPGSS